VGLDAVSVFGVYVAFCLGGLVFGGCPGEVVAADFYVVVCLGEVLVLLHWSRFKDAMSLMSALQEGYLTYKFSKLVIVHSEELSIF